MRRSASLFALTLLACEPEQQTDVVLLRYLAKLPHHDPRVIEGAEDYLGMQLVVSDKNPIDKSVVVIKINESHDGFGGATEFAHSPCDPIVWVVENDFIFAHEMGHALGLQHVDDDDNLMSPDHAGAGWLTEDQMDTMRSFAWKQQHDCG